MKLMFSPMQKFQVLGRLCKPNHFVSSARRSTSSDEYTGEISYYEKYINEVKLLGRVGSEPHYISYQGKSGICFVLGTRKAESAEGSQLDWHNVFTYDPVLVKSVQTSVKKGVRIYVSGMLTSLQDSNAIKKTVGVRIFRLINFP